MIKLRTLFAFFDVDHVTLGCSAMMASHLAQHVPPLGSFKTTQRRR